MDIQTPFKKCDATIATVNANMIKIHKVVIIVVLRYEPIVFLFVAVWILAVPAKIEFIEWISVVIVEVKIYLSCSDRFQGLFVVFWAFELCYLYELFSVYLYLLIYLFCRNSSKDAWLLVSIMQYYLFYFLGTSSLKALLFVLVCLLILLIITWQFHYKYKGQFQTL